MDIQPKNDLSLVHTDAHTLDTHTLIHSYTYTLIHSYTHTLECANTTTHVRTHVRAQTNGEKALLDCTYGHMVMSMCKHEHTRTYVRTHTHKYTHKRTYARIETHLNVERERKRVDEWYGRNERLRDGEIERERDR